MISDEFLANVSLELRTPLTGVLAMTETLQAQTFGPLNERQLQLLQRMEHSGRHLLDTINDMLDLSRVDAGLLDLGVTECALEPLCQECVQAVAGAAAAKRQSVHFSIEPQSLRIAADPRRLRQMLVNLLDNAVKFTPECGSLGLQVTGFHCAGDPLDCIGSDRYVRFVVWDTGIGIVREDRDKLFRPFSQLDSSLTRRHSGTGLGLALVKRMAELHGGHVGVESSPGQGSRFCISLPWRAPETVQATCRQARGYRW